MSNFIVEQEIKMPNRDKTGPSGKGPATGRGKGPCGTTEKQLDKQRGTGLGPCGNGKPRGGAGAGGGQGKGRGQGGQGKGQGGRRKGPNGITYFK